MTRARLFLNLVLLFLFFLFLIEQDFESGEQVAAARVFSLSTGFFRVGKSAVRSTLPSSHVPPPFPSFFVPFLFKIYRGVRRANLIRKVSGRNYLSFHFSPLRTLAPFLPTLSPPPSPAQRGWKISPLSDPRGKKVSNVLIVVVVVFDKERFVINLDQNKTRIVYNRRKQGVVHLLPPPPPPSLFNPPHL